MKRVVGRGLVLFLPLEGEEGLEGSGLRGVVGSRGGRVLPEEGLRK
jgi:hypothetical protein